MERNIHNNISEIFVQAYQDYGEPLRRRARRKVNNGDLVDDLVQNTFLKAWQYLGKGGKITSVKAFLFHILNNLIIDEYRKRQSISLDTLVEDGFQIISDDQDRLTNILDGQITARLIPRLTEKYRLAVSLRYLSDEPLKSIALTTHQTKNAVAVQIHRGLRKLTMMSQVYNL